MKKTIFLLMVALATLTFSCEEFEEDIVPEKEKSALKSTENPFLFKPQMNMHPTTTMVQSTVDWIPAIGPGYIYATDWRQPYNFAGYYEGVRLTPYAKFSRYALQIKSNGSPRCRTLFRVEPTLDPQGYDGHVAFMVKGKAGEYLRIYTVVATAGEGDVNIIPDSEEEHLWAWHWFTEPGVYTDPTGNILLTGDWQYVQKNVAQDFWQLYSNNPGAGFDRFPPYADDFYVMFEEMDYDDEEPFYIDFIVNGETTVPSPIGTHELEGDFTYPEVGTTYTYTFQGAPFFNQYEWTLTTDRGTISGSGNSVTVNYATSGSALMKVRGKYNQMGWSDWTTSGIYTVANPQPPQPPQPPYISGATSVSLNSTSGYYQPSGKQAYEWQLPYGCSSVQQYNNVKVIYFYSGGNKTIQGRYKENDVWSAWGYKSVNVSYY